MALRHRVGHDENAEWSREISGHTLVILSSTPLMIDFDIERLEQRLASVSHAVALLKQKSCMKGKRDLAFRLSSIPSRAKRSGRSRHSLGKSGADCVMPRLVAIRPTIERTVCQSRNLVPVVQGGLPMTKSY